MICFQNVEVSINSTRPIIRQWRIAVKMTNSSEDAKAACDVTTDTETVRLGLEALVRHAAYERLRALRREKRRPNEGQADRLPVSMK